MRLSDIMGAMQLELFAEVGLVIFFAVFVAITIRLYVTKSEQKLHDLARFMPLQDEQPLQPRRLSSKAEAGGSQP